MKKYILIFFLFIMLTGCEARNTDKPIGETISEHNVTYVLTCLQHRPFIATQDAERTWYFAGPLDGPCK